MRMTTARRRTWLALAGIVVAGSMLTWVGRTVAQEQGEDAMKQAMAAMMAAAEPNDHHAELARMAGTWKAVGKFFNPMAPDAPPQESEGKATNTMILGGRFLTTEFQGSFMDMAFSGFGIEGYDNLRKAHVQSWVDSMGTMMLTAEGHCNADHSVRTMVSEFLDPMTGQMTKMRQVITFKSADEHVWEAYNLMPDGSEMKTMEIVYSR
ncbi:MAG: DUF1579 domain-containing protein [Acidobacteriota bacterium]